MRKWYCLRCMVEHDVIDGVVQCHLAIDRPFKPVITADQMVKDWRYVTRCCNIETGEAKSDG